MKNPNQKPVLTLEEKQLPEVKGLYYPMKVFSYDESTDTFSIVCDERYEHEGRDTAHYDLDDFDIPAVAIHAITGADTDFEEPQGWVGHLFLMVGAPLNAK